MKAPLAGAVFAGGHSRRMGTDKALLMIEGQPLWLRQACVLRDAGAAPVRIVRRPEQSDVSEDIAYVRDQTNGIGPLAGLQATLESSPSPLVAVLAVDMPAIDATWFETLRAQCDEDLGVVARHANGFEPLAAIYPRAALATVERQISRGVFSLQRFVTELVNAGLLRAIEMPDAERGRFANVNTPAELVAFAPNASALVSAQM